MNYDLTTFQHFKKKEYKVWLNDALINIYVKRKHTAQLKPISHLLHNDDISLALFSFYQSLSEKQQTRFQQAVAEVIYAFVVKPSTVPAYLDLFDLVKLGQMHLCLNNIAVKLGRTVLSEHSTSAEDNDFDDDNDDIFYFGLIAITSMAGASIEVQPIVENALYTLVKSPNFKRSYEDYTAKILYALCVNNNTDCAKYFKELYPTVQQQFYQQYETKDEDEMNLADYLNEISQVIGKEKLLQLPDTQPNTQIEPKHSPVVDTSKPKVVSLLTMASELGYIALTESEG